MCFYFRGKLYDLLHSKPGKSAAPSSYDTKTSINEYSTARPSSPMVEHPTSPTASSSKPNSKFGNSSPTSQAPPSKEQSAFEAKWEAPIARQRRYNQGLPPLPGEPEYTAEEKREAKGLKQLEEMYRKIQLDNTLGSACKTADENFKKWMDEDEALRARNREDYEKRKKEEDAGA